VLPADAEALVDRLYHVVCAHSRSIAPSLYRPLLEPGDLASSRPDELAATRSKPAPADRDDDHGEQQGEARQKGDVEVPARHCAEDGGVEHGRLSRPAGRSRKRSRPPGRGRRPSLVADRPAQPGRGSLVPASPIRLDFQDRRREHRLGPGLGSMLGGMLLVHGCSPPWRAEETASDMPDAESYISPTYGPATRRA